MSNLMRREQMTVRDLMDRLFDEYMSDDLIPVGRSIVPAMDIYQTDNEVVVKATMPGVKAEDLHVSITGDTLTLQGEMKEEKEVKAASYHMRERRSGTFSRSITLPVRVQVENAKAEFTDGVLTLTLPKAEEVRPKTITIKAK